LSGASFDAARNELRSSGFVASATV
jgi:hypothetical protein